MNNLDREIKKGELVVVELRVMRNKKATIEERTFICSGDGFGTASYTNGTAVFGKWKKDGEHSRIEGSWIDAEETKKLQEGLK